MKTLVRSLGLLLWVIGLTGFIYPVFVTLVGYLFLFEKAQGSLVSVDGQIIGSQSLAQSFTSPRYFWPRPSARHYSLLPAGGSQLAAGSAQLAKQVDERRTFLAKAHHKPLEEVPHDLLFTSGSGVDPSISLYAAQFQIERIIEARQWPSEFRSKLSQLVNDMVEHDPRLFPGESAVNVIMLNILLDQLEKEDKNG